MFSSRIFWTAVGAYLVVIGAVAWGFGRLRVDSGLPEAASRRLIWEVAVSVGALGLFLTWALLRMAAVRLSALAETAAARDAGGTRHERPADLRSPPRNLESAIDSM